jgi:hypothetical protein
MRDVEKIGTRLSVVVASLALVLGLPAAPRIKAPGEQQGAMLIVENVTLGPSQRVGASKRGIRNLIPITGGTVSGRIARKVVRGGADYQILSPPATIDAHYLWETDDGEVIIVRNGGAFGSLGLPTAASSWTVTAVGLVARGSYTPAR